VQRAAVDEVFSTIRAGAGTAAVSNSSPMVVRLNATATLNQFESLLRIYVLFDTSIISASGTISSAVFSGYGIQKEAGNGSPDLHLASSSPASNTDLVAADYQQVGITSFGSITYANFTGLQYNDITLNAAGVTNISKTGISKFSLQTSWDINNSFTGAWVSLANTDFRIGTAELTGTSEDPKLVVTYTVPANSKQDVIWFD